MSEWGEGGGLGLIRMDEYQGGEENWETRERINCDKTDCQNVDISSDTTFIDSQQYPLKLSNIQDERHFFQFGILYKSDLRISTTETIENLSELNTCQPRICLIR